MPAISNSCDTTASRWSLTRNSAFQDLRQENALINDFNNDGNDDLLIIQRHHHLWNFADSGFDVLVTDPTTQIATIWYKCTNSIDYPNEICSKLNLAFDNARFLSGDFDGDGFADLMVITRKDYGAAFWLLKSDGTKFNAPVPWYSTDPTWDPNLAQQYVSADFTGDGKTDVLIAHQRGTSGLNYWVLSSNGLTGNAPQLWYEGVDMGVKANLKPAKLHVGDLKSDLLSFENGNPFLRIRPLFNTDSTFTTPGANLYKSLNYLSSKPVIANLNADGISDILVLHKRGDGPNIDVWQLLNEGGFSKPLAISTIVHTAWADQIPYLMTRNAQDPWLAMVRRPNEVFQPTEDHSQPTNYWRLGGVGLYTHTLTTGNFDATGTDRGMVTNPSDPFGLIYQDLLRLERLN